VLGKDRTSSALSLALYHRLLVSCERDMTLKLPIAREACCVLWTIHRSDTGNLVVRAWLNALCLGSLMLSAFHCPVKTVKHLITRPDVLNLWWNVFVCDRWIPCTVLHTWRAAMRSCQVVASSPLIAWMWVSTYRPCCVVVVPVAGIWHFKVFRLNLYEHLIKNCSLWCETDPNFYFK